MSDVVTSQPETSCFSKTSAWLKLLTMPVEYPVTESHDKGWQDPCNCLCGTLCFIPKASVLFLTLPCFCCNEKTVNVQNL